MNGRRTASIRGGGTSKPGARTSSPGERLDDIGIAGALTYFTFGTASDTLALTARREPDHPVSLRLTAEQHGNHCRRAGTTGASKGLESFRLEGGSLGCPKAGAGFQDPSLDTDGQRTRSASGCSGQPCTAGCAPSRSLRVNEVGAADDHSLPELPRRLARQVLHAEERAERAGCPRGARLGGTRNGARRSEPRSRRSLRRARARRSEPLRGRLRRRTRSGRSRRLPRRLRGSALAPPRAPRTSTLRVTARSRTAHLRGNNGRQA